MQDDNFEIWDYWNAKIEIINMKNMAFTNFGLSKASKENGQYG